METGVKFITRGANHRVMSMAGVRSYFSKSMKEIVVRGHHMYKHVWMSGIGEELQ